MPQRQRFTLEDEKNADTIVHREANDKRNWHGDEIVQPDPFLEQQQRAIVRHKAAKRGNRIAQRLNGQSRVATQPCSCLFKTPHKQQYTTRKDALNTFDFSHEKNNKVTIAANTFICYTIRC